MACRLTHVQKVRTLYKTILKLHRGLPDVLRDLGDVYVNAEFKRHKNCNESETNLFMGEWKMYALNISELGLRGKGENNLRRVVTEEELKAFRDEQIAQLYALMLATKGRVK